MIRLKSLELLEAHLELKEPFQISSGTSRKRRILLLRLEDRDGFEGWSECVAGDRPNYSYETIDTAWSVITRFLAPRVLGRAFQSPEEVSPVLARNIRGHNMAKAALEMGVWELQSRRQGLPLARILGGSRNQVAVGISLGIQDHPAELARKVEDALAQGYRKVKIKIQPGSDLEFLEAVRLEIGTGIDWMVDANNAYNLDDLDLLRRLDDYQLMMIEQPLAHDDLVRHAALQKALKTAVCLDESITGVDRVEDMITLGSGRIVNIKPGRVGGFLCSKAIHDLCQKNGIPVWCGGMLESGVGRAHNVALASLPNFLLPGDLSPSARYWHRDIVVPEWTMSDQGLVQIPLDRPGMGVEVDRVYLDRLVVRREVLD